MDPPLLMHTVLKIITRVRACDRITCAEHSGNKAADQSSLRLSAAADLELVATCRRFRPGPEPRSCLRGKEVPDLLSNTTTSRRRPAGESWPAKVGTVGVASYIPAHSNISLWKQKPFFLTRILKEKFPNLLCFSSPVSSRNIITMYFISCVWWSSIPEPVSSFCCGVPCLLSTGALAVRPVILCVQCTAAAQRLNHQGINHAEVAQLPRVLTMVLQSFQFLPSRSALTWCHWRCSECVPKFGLPVERSHTMAGH